MTLRDLVWDDVLRRLPEAETIRLQDLDFDDRQRHTARRVLREMAELGWLERAPTRLHIWTPGPLAKLYLVDGAPEE